MGAEWETMGTDPDGDVLVQVPKYLEKNPKARG